MLKTCLHMLLLITQVPYKPDIPLPEKHSNREPKISSSYQILPYFITRNAVLHDTTTLKYKTKAKNLKVKNSKVKKPGS